jgi:hypothetical protein
VLVTTHDGGLLSFVRCIMRNDQGKACTAPWSACGGEGRAGGRASGRMSGEQRAHPVAGLFELDVETLIVERVYSHDGRDVGAVAGGWPVGSSVVALSPVLGDRIAVRVALRMCLRVWLSRVIPQLLRVKM